ncbi:MAG: cation:proton antiporter [Spirochaetales bacterium]|nr:cation:proton antiporter [Spirochaetales bacterium]
MNEALTHSAALQPLLLVGIMVALGFYAGKSMKYIKLPSIIGFMLIGVVLGPSLFNLLNEEFQHNLSFISDVALSFVAVSIGIELSFSSLKKQGKGIILVIFTESFMAFLIVTGALYLLTRDIALSLIFGAIAPASAPAGTVAIIQEYKAKGPLTKALFSVVGFDDGLGIIIFGFAAAIAKSFLAAEAGQETGSLMMLLAGPLKEVIFSIIIGLAIGFLFCLLARKLKSARDIFILMFATILISSGISNMLHLSIILTNMVMGIFIVNTQPFSLVEKIHNELSEFMPLLFVMFFVLAGANLHVSALPSLGLLGLVYILGRSSGLMGGAALGSTLGKLPENIRKYLGMGILSQAGVAIGLALIVKNEFAAYGPHGAYIGNTVITTVTATCIFFEIIGPILTKIGLEKAGEIRTA